MQNHAWLVALPIAAAAIGSPPVAAAPSACDAVSGNMVQNCGFETGNLANWSSGGTVDSRIPHTGTYGFTTRIPTSQTISGFTIGEIYTLSFWAREAPGLRLAVSLGNASLFPAIALEFAYQQYTTTFTASVTSADLTFTFNSYGDLDDVVITPNATAVPEPAGLAVLGAGLAGLIGARRRRPA